jgi:hypothetical protein
VSEKTTSAPGEWSQNQTCSNGSTVSEPQMSALQHPERAGSDYQDVPGVEFPTLLQGRGLESILHPGAERDIVQMEECVGGHDIARIKVQCHVLSEDKVDPAIEPTRELGARST